MNGGLLIAAVVGAATALFALWCWVMGRLDERERRREAERLRRQEPPVLGGAARHRQRGGQGR